MTNLILASSSPRRKELLSFLGYEFEIIPADIDENIIVDELPSTYVQRMSREKGEVIAKIQPEKFIISADTTVVLDDQILGKPVDEKESKEMILKLSGRSHMVFTAFSLSKLKINLNVTKIVETKVTFKNLSENEINKYVSSGEGLDKAGAYGFQAMGMSLITKIEGSPSNVIGLPLVELSEVLSEYFHE